MAYINSSPYYTTKLNNGYLDVMTFREITSQTDDVLYEITENYQNRPDLLAYDLYNDANLWWVFALRNQNVIKDPIFDFVAGTRIYIPNKSVVQKSLGL